LKKNEEFATRLKALDKDPRTSKLGLQSYLILPIQRIPRYRLLLEDYIKHTDSNHQDYEGLQKALAAIIQVADGLNKAMKEIEGRNAVVRIQDMLPQNLELLQPHRRFMFEKKVVDVNTTGSDYIFVMNDILLFCIQRSETKFDYRGQINFNHATMFDFIGSSTPSAVSTPHVNSIYGSPSFNAGSFSNNNNNNSPLHSLINNNNNNSNSTNAAPAAEPIYKFKIKSPDAQVNITVNSAKEKTDLMDQLSALIETFNAQKCM